MTPSDPLILAGCAVVFFGAMYWLWRDIRKDGQL